MSEPKVQLIDPQGNISLPGMNATGVITASSLDGAGGVVTGLTGNPNLNVGVVTATSFVGDGTGHAAGLTGTPNLNLGLTTATSFVGDATGKAAGLTGTPNLNVGLITASNFAGDVTGNVTGNVSGNLTGNITGDVTGNITGDVTGNITGNIGGDVEGDVTGNVSGLARGLGISANGVWAGAGTSQINAGVVTAIQYYGDGSGLTGAGSSASIAQEITAVGAETIIDLSDGNLIYYKGASDTTVGFASTSAAEQITLVRDASPTFTESYNISYSSGGVTFDGSGDYLELAANSDFAFGTGDFTIELWFQVTSNSTHQSFITDWDNFGWQVEVYDDGKCQFAWGPNSTAYWSITGDTVVSTNTWYHLAVVRNGNTFTQYLNGVVDGSFTSSTTAATNGQINIGYNNDNGAARSLNGKISNLRVLKGTALYTGPFLPPPAPLTNITNTKLLCCQSTSSTTTAAVTPGTITANGDPTAGAQTVTLSGTNTVNNSTSITWPERVKWNGYVTPVLSNTSRSKNSFQIFHFTTADTGATYQAWEENVSEATYGQIWKWGNNSQGQIGDNSTVNKSSPIQIAGAWEMASFVSGAYMGAGVKVGGTGWMWGYNNAGSLGQNNRTNYSSPVQLPGTTWSSISVNYGKAYGIKTDNTYWIWGYGNRGQLGLNLGGSVRRSSPTQIPGSWSEAGPLGQAGEGTYGIKTDGTMWVWGRHNYGQLGLNQPGGNPAMISSPTQLPGTGWTRKIAGHDSAWNGIKSNGALWGVGSQGSGALGLNGSHSVPISSPAQVGTDTTWKDVTSNKYGCAATKTDGTLWTWGQNGNGEMALNSTSPAAYSSPVQVGTDTNWDIPLTIGADRAGALKTDGTLWVWGKNNNGGLGLNDKTYRSSPTQVPGTYLAGDVRGAISAGVAGPIVMRP